MSVVLGCIADDYTGASDLANTLSRNGLRTIQTIGIPADTLTLPDVDAVVVSLKSRSIPAGQAVLKSLDAEAWLRAQGAEHVLFKICSTFDSTDAGNIGPVTDALRQRSGDAIVIVTPAFPETGRTVFKGHLFVGTLLLSNSPLKDHPLNPMRDSDLRRVLARQSQSPVGLVELATVAKGAAAITDRLAHLAAEGKGAAVVDAVFDGDLETVGVAALGARVSVGASGLGLGLARGLVKTGRVKVGSRQQQAALAAGGYAACLAGSCSQATLQQISHAEKHMPVLRLDPHRVLRGEDEVGRALEWAASKLAAGPVLIASSATPDQVTAVQAQFGREAAGHVIEQTIARIAAGLVECGVHRLVVAGGESSGAVVDRLGVTAFLLGPEIAAGVPVLHGLEWAGGRLVMALKSGNFGGPDFFTDALALMP